MSDRRDDEFDEEEDDLGPSPAREGVRILGADEARAVMESGRAKPRRSEDEPKFGDVPPRPDPALRPAARFPRPQDDPQEASWSASSEGLVPEEPPEPPQGPPPTEPPQPPPRPVPPRSTPERAPAEPPPRRTEQSGPVDLPHWTEPATGEVPVILPEAEGTRREEDPDDLAAWSKFATGTPRFRGAAEDWTEADFEGESLKDDTTSLGALADEPVADDEEQFERQLARRRGRRAGAGPRAPRHRDGEEAPARPRPPEIDEEGTPAPPDLTVRFVTAGIMVIVALIAFWIGRGATALLAALIVGLAAVELYEGMRRRGFHPATPLGLLGSVALVIIAYLHGSAAYPMVITLVVVFSLLWYMAEVVRARPASGLGATLLGFAYVGGLGAFAGLLLGAPNGIGLLVGVALCAIAYDVAGYFVGSQFGKRPLLPHISPNKTVEGLVGGMVAAIVVGVLTSTILGLTPWDERATYGLWLGLVVAITAPLGDLCESMLKRDLGLKDFGTVLPGHGGVLDRFDGLLISMPAVYYLVLHLGIG